MKLTVTTIPPELVKLEKRYTLELSEAEATLLMHLVDCWMDKKDCPLSAGVKAFCYNLDRDLRNEGVQVS